MIFHRTKIDGVWVLEPERHEDERGFFARIWCRREMEAHGLSPDLVQCNISWNRRRGTLRGLHYQAEPHTEAKLVRVVRGAVFDVAVDLRPRSSTRGQWVGAELTAANGRMLYIAEELAHGFQTLEDDTELLYCMSQFHRPGSGRGIHHADPGLAIDWPIPDPILSDHDAALPTLAEASGRG